MYNILRLNLSGKMRDGKMTDAEMTDIESSFRGRPESMSRSRGGGVFEGVTVCDRGRGSKKYVTSHFAKKIHRYET